MMRRMTWKPHLTVASVIERDGKFLLVEEHEAGQRVFNQPAGHVEDGESLIEAVIRETREETGWEFRPVSLIGLYRWVHPGRGITFLRAAFAGDLLAHDPARPLDPDIIATHWLAPDALQQPGFATRSPLVERCVDDFLRGQRYPLDLLIDL